MATTRTKIGHGLAKLFNIKLQENEPYLDEVSREEPESGTAVFVEQPVTVSEYFHDISPTGKGVANYVKSLFPFLSWIGKYNFIWLAGDMVAGITIGAVVVPQGMGYAKLAELPVEFGLYSSFMGVLIYWFFATSKDITIGPVAVMSQLTGNIVLALQDQFPDVEAYQIASCLAILAGAIVFFIGFIRIGWIVDMIPLVSLSAYMTGSAINILVGQVPTLLGETFPKPWTTRDPTYRVMINTLKYLPTATLDSAMGLTALVLLYAIRHACQWLAKKNPKHQKLLFFISTLRTVFVILLYTMISWLVNMHHRSDPKFKILGTVPRGFQNAGAPLMTKSLVSALVEYLPSTVIVLLIEHIAISKSFGRVNNYTINPSQEMVAIGIANLLGPFLGAYPATGSFSRTAIKARAGVRTPFAGVISAVVVLLAIYALPAVFFYIPSASLSAVIIHAVGDLVTPPDTVYQFWRVSPFEVIIFFAGVLVTVFSSIEDGIYTTICISAAMLLYRILRSRGRFLGRVKVNSVQGSSVLGKDADQRLGEYGTFGSSSSNPTSHIDHPLSRNVYLPINHGDGSNPAIALSQPYPGIFIYRFSEGFNYPNANHTLEYMVECIFEQTRRTSLNSYPRPGDRPWNDPGPSKRALKKALRGEINLNAGHEDLPTVQAIILDFSAVNFVDVTSVQALIDVRNQLDRYAAPDFVDWHIACINNRWAKRALVAAGFGYPNERPDGQHHRWQSIFSVAEMGGEDSPAAQAEAELNEKTLREREHPGKVEEGLHNPDHINVAETGSASGSSQEDEIKKTATRDQGSRLRQRRAVAVHSANRPLFHVDLTSALQSAIANVEARASAEPRSTGEDEDAKNV
ncbi:putative sulfate transporter [Cryphonectria parasitica EP155]|uniref:Sulfate transporter n=1 Tax=Cryphonectria parasitica (strain ATCC 38755 / EP155) TaxID=660469 RepID=A0A9P4Y9I5_CRYP1|nr:putative sulfate transporter [Cryphonectria parasitica EP155]KAF3768899.1 putative sulfate transporter [Cryphonectria parasitica EP155]